ncbi:ATP-binding protein [Paenibacillus sp. FSL K6-2524]|uniref:ATP-binding protein n=1 Tax=Paenibacillus sp. FSL K6-2524 TaxID=2954516 RepID=UPI0030F8EB8C
MKVIYKGMVILVALLAIIFSSFFLKGSERENPNETKINQLKIVWTDQLDTNISKKQLEDLDGWKSYTLGASQSLKPNKESSQWVELELPLLNSSTQAVLFEKIYGYHVVVKHGDNIIYESRRNYNYEINRILVPINPKLDDTKLYVGIQSKHRVGIQDQIRVGDYYNLEHSFISSNLTDLILGSALIFIAIVMIICSLFLHTEHMSSWISLCALIMSSGLIVATYSPLLYSWYEDSGRLFVILFDSALFILLPSFTYFFESVFGNGYFSIIKRYRKFQVVYSLFCFVLMIINEWSGYKYYSLYSLFTADLLGFIMIIQFVILISISIIYAIKGNRDAVIFTTGFMIFTVLSVSELTWFYSRSGYYELFLWKWGVISFLISLMIILGRKFARTHLQVVEYSKQLEVFNNELQRSEKMEIISELAASVAHEVRNPLQVTRGFIQLLAEKQEKKSEKVYLNMALEELDRASGIITDFLTFAKPEAGNVTTLDILEEFIHIEGILVPMANLQGGRITVSIPNELYILGNSSKFKQAFVNIIKNSIEALSGEGEIVFWAYEEKDQVCIHIKDNGEGMDEEVLTRLGEPYFSNKTKGTGLGLMVTFRIIEVMNGKITFTSKKGVGTEVTIRFPSAKKV